MDRDPRVEELTNLRLALATFALQLDAFEARLKGRSPKTTLKAFHPAPPDISVASKILVAMKERPRNRAPHKNSPAELPAKKTLSSIQPPPNSLTPAVRS